MRGRHNNIADALSREPVDYKPETHYVGVSDVNFEFEFKLCSK